MKVPHILLLVFVLSYGSNANAEDNVTDRIRTSDGAECYQSTNTGKEVTTGVRLRGDTLNNRVEPELYLEFTFTLGKDKLDKDRIDCAPMSELEQVRMKLDNDKLRLELELLRNQLKKQNKSVEKDSFEEW